ncbi:MAG: SCO family protein, partial [Pseudomonadota bacterium]|nr:SCO family protein [Pseudomonadota bacterium]
MKLKPIVLFAMLAILAVVGTLLAFQKSNDSNPTPGKIGGDFTLSSATGAASLSDYEGKLKLLFFGYTH